MQGKHRPRTPTAIIRVVALGLDGLPALSARQCVLCEAWVLFQRAVRVPVLCHQSSRRSV